MPLKISVASFVHACKGISLPKDKVGCCFHLALEYFKQSAHFSTSFFQLFIQTLPIHYVLCMCLNLDAPHVSALI